MSRNGEIIELASIPPGEYHTSSWMSPGVQEQDAEVREPVDPPSNAVSDSTPSRNYQALLLLSGFLMIFWIIGLNSVYGVFQEYYTSTKSSIKDAQGQDALVSLVGTLGYGLTWGGGIFVNPIMLRTKNLLYVTLSGAVLSTLGLFLASFSTRLWHLFLTQALLYGVGATLCYFPIMSFAPRFFDRHRGFAMGVILSGNGIGGLVLAPITQTLLDHLGVRWTLRALALVNLLILTPIAFVPRQPPGFEARRRGDGRTRLNLKLVTRGVFIGQAVGCFLQAAGNIVPLFYLTTFSTSILHYSSSKGSLLLALNNAVNSIARIVMGILADRVGRQNTLVTSVLLSSITVLALWYDASPARFLAFVILYGVLAGGYNALLPTTITEVYGVQNYDAVNGSIYFLRGLGAIAGPPIAGAILGSHSRGSVASASNTLTNITSLRTRYNDLVIYDGMLLIGASMCVVYVRWSDAKEKGSWRWRA